MNNNENQLDLCICNHSRLLHLVGCTKCKCNEFVLDIDLTPWCGICGAKTKEKCKCGDTASNE